MKIAIVYASNTHTTTQLAQAIKRGVLQQSNNTHIYEYHISREEIVCGRFVNKEIFDELATCDAIIMGTPTYMGNVSAEFKSFFDASGEYWVDQPWANKVSAGFTCGGGLNGDQGNTLSNIFMLAAQHGMVWVGLDLPGGCNKLGLNRLGCQIGVVANAHEGNVNEIDIKTAEYLGTRVARITELMTGKF